MSESIPALIAEAREHAEALMPKQPVVGLIRRLADALESLSASPGDDEREALESVVAEAIAGAVDLAQVDAVAGPVNAAYWKSRIAKLAVKAVLSQSSLPEPAEDEYAHAANGDEFMDWSSDPQGALARRRVAGRPVPIKETTNGEN